jgi:drug/metabolite transporter, DME family
MPRVAILSAAVLFGTTGTAQALAGVGAPVAVGAARIALGGALLAALALLRGELRGLGASWPTVVVCALGVAGYQLAFFVAVRETGVAVGTVVAIGAAAVLTGALEWLIEDTRPGRRWAVATGIAVAGLALLPGGSSAGARVSTLGIGLALAAAAGYASYAVLSKRLLRAGHAPVGVMGSTFGLAGLLLLPVLAATGASWLGRPEGAALALYLAAGPTAVAYVLYARGLRRVSAGEATTIGLAEPLVAVLLGTLVLHEDLRAPVLAGGALILAALLVLTVRAPRLRPWRPLPSRA